MGIFVFEEGMGCWVNGQLVNRFLILSPAPPAQIHTFVKNLPLSALPLPQSAVWEFER